MYDNLIKIEGQIVINGLIKTFNVEKKPKEITYCGKKKQLEEKVLINLLDSLFRKIRMWDSFINKEEKCLMIVTLFEKEGKYTYYKKNNDYDDVEKIIELLEGV